jgi:hypothetical protein
MSLTGKELVSLIQATLDYEARKEQQELRDDMAESAAPILKQFDLEKHSDEMFDLFRSIDMTTPNALEREKLFRSRLRSWGVEGGQDSHNLYMDLALKYSELRTRLFSSRSLSAHVGAVLRPFRRRYLDAWAEASLPGFNLNAVSVAVDNLSILIVEDEVGLSSWAKDVYELFSSTAVIRTTVGESKQKRPLGMIGEGSERTYKQQWFAWIKSSGPTLLRSLKDSETGQFEHAPGSQRGFNQSVASRDQERTNDMVINFASSSLAEPMALRQRRQFDEPTTTTFMAPPESPALQHTTELTIRVSDSIEPTLVADRSWSDKKFAVSDVEGWVSNLIRFWGGPERIASVQIEFKEAGNESTFPLPPLPLGQIADVIVSAINSYR